ncbi:S1C family serine protease [Anaerostipes amylophilus]|jgi:serine protease Do|uniref:S1C family serine protease n=1 Tax=Anaerostipes amylophilus TaxID=2981779 RepID=UPI0006C60C19|nr:trypsin-like peptidase domain-containing protein [Anaerostipes amylophilus]MCU6780079.1 trypsin-like peptidase domain-containing protein [Anaerostipes amylophilus]CUN34576.1 Putative serine protease HtrA [Anaerostipes hadrus]
MDGYHTNQDGQWKTSDQWRAEEANTSNKKPKKSGRGKYAAKLVASAVAFGLIAGLVMQGVTYGFSKAGIGNGATQLATTKTTSSSSSTSSEDLSGVSSNVMPSIVSITGKFETTSQSWFGQTQSSESEGVGSGIIIGKKDGKILIVTNNHVVADAKSLSVGFVDGKSASATIRGTDSDADLAVVEVNTKDMKASTLKKIAVITLGDSSKLKTGERAIAIGNALGYGQSVTGGYISALNRQVQLTDKTMTLIQTDAAINPGNSGGALLNSKGELIGINTVKYSSEDVEGMGYAIPINTAKPIINKLIKNEATSESEQAYLGVSGQTIDSSMASQFDMPSGVYVQQVIKSSPAQKAGISAGDVIVSIDGSSVSTMDGLKEKISNLKAGKKVKIVVKRQNQMGTYEKKTLTVTLGKKSDAPSTSSNSGSSNSSNSGNSNNSGSSNSYNNNYNNESSDSQYYSYGQ